jgi:integrase
MARLLRDSSLESRTARSRLPVQHGYYRKSLDQKLLLLYRKGERGGAWSASLYVGNGKYRTERIGTADDAGDPDGIAIFSYSQAQAAARKLFDQATRSAAGLPEVSAGPYTVADAMADYTRWLEQDGRGDAATNTRGTIDAFIVPKLGTVRLDRLTKKQIQDWLHGLARSAPRLRVRAGMKQRHRVVDLTDAEVRRQRRSTANRIFTVLKAGLNQAWRDDRVSSDKPWRSVKPYKGADASRAGYLQTDQCVRLTNASDPDFRDLVQAALFTGARYSELCRLAPGDFNQDSGTVAVRASKSSKPRHIILTEDGAAFFARCIAKAGNRARLFVRADGEAWRKSWQARPMRAACEAARIVPAIGFHQLRHTWASWTVMGGAPLLVVAQNLGHADTRMVEKHYGHLAPSYKADAIRAAAPRYGFAVDKTVTPLRPR